MRLKDYVITARVNGWHATVGFLVEAGTAKEAVKKAETYCKNMKLDYTINRRAPVADAKTVERFEKEYPDSMLC
jgi:hypothetical protein